MTRDYAYCTDPADRYLGDSLSPADRVRSDEEKRMAVHDDAGTLLHHAAEIDEECDCEAEVVEGRWVRLYCATCREREYAA